MSHVSYVKQTVSLLPRHQPSSWALSSETRRVQLWDITWLHVRYDSWRCGRQGSCICGSQWVSFRTVASSSAKFVGAVIWNTTHSVVWHDFFTFEMWILQVCETWLTHMLLNRYSSVLKPRHQPSSWALSCKTRRRQLWDMNELNYKTWLLSRMRRSSAEFVSAVSETRHTQLWDVTWSHMRDDSCKYETWLNQIQLLMHIRH